MSANNVNLFGSDDEDDSSDSDQENVPTTTNADTDTATDKVKTRNVDQEEIGEKEEDDDDDDDDSDDEDDNIGTKRQASKPIANDGLNDDDSDNNNNDNDDDDDNEFNEEEAAVSGRQKTEEELQREREMEEAKRVEEDPDAAAAAMEEEQEKLAPPRKLTVLDIPRPIPSSSSSSDNKSATLVSKNSPKVTMHMTKLPNIVNINTEPYDKELYLPEEEEREFNGYVHNMIRWRYKKDPTTGELLRDERGKLLRESNARIVKWSDGSMTLHVGTETFEVDSLGSILNNHPKSKFPQKQPPPKNIFPGMNGYLYLSQKATLSETNQSMGTVLECMGPIQSKLVPRPSLKSEAHKNLTLAVRQRNMKKSRIAEYVTQVDPEKAANERIKNRDDLHRNKTGGGTSRRSIGSRGSMGSAGGRIHRRPNRKFYNRDDDLGNYDSVNIKHLKNGIDDDDYGNMNQESDSEDDAAWRNRKRYKKKNWAEEETRNRSDDDDEDMDEGAEEDDVPNSDSDDEDFNLNRKRKKRENLFEDDDD